MASQSIKDDDGVASSRPLGPMTVTEYAQYRRKSESTIRRRLAMGMPHRAASGMPIQIDPVRADTWHVEDAPKPRRSRGRPPRAT
jgi:hypothetical protein